VARSEWIDTRESGDAARSWRRVGHAGRDVARSGAISVRGNRNTRRVADGGSTSVNVDGHATSTSSSTSASPPDASSSTNSSRSGLSSISSSAFSMSSGSPSSSSSAISSSSATSCPSDCANGCASGTCEIDVPRRVRARSPASCERRASWQVSSAGMVRVMWCAPRRWGAPSSPSTGVVRAARTRARWVNR